MHYAIIGCGASGLQAAITIREHDPSADITLISSDLWPFYLKPVLADYISGRIDSTRMVHLSTSTIEQMDINILSGKRVTRIVPENNMIIFSDHTTLDYQFLLIATGTHPMISSHYLPFIGQLRSLNSLADAVRIKNETQRGNKAVVIGGGHYAIEMLRSLHSLKFELSLLTDDACFWSDDDPVPAGDIKDRLEEKRIDVHWNDEIADIIDLDGECYRLITQNGLVCDTQMLLYAPTYVPNMDFLAGTSIKTDKGILVSEDLRTSIPNVFACGDVAQVYDLNKKTNRINFGWTSASRQGKIAGLSMIGRDSVFIPAQEQYFREMYGEKLLNRW